mmetsp:Transcript_34379/g.107475  ORF Transcript_34379/g.107475 Transcript_34379/m.107475 type:complete len:299 (-) Transcript_34379:51-947(-)
MAPGAESPKESTWLRSLGAAAAAVTIFKVQSQQDLGTCVFPEKVGNVPEEPRQWSAFEFAELLEEGLGPGIASDHMQAPRDLAKQMKLRVQRSPDRREYVLQTEKGQDLLVARVNADGTQYDFFPAKDTQSPRALGPTFRLTSNPAKDQWSLYTTRCDQCESRGKRQCGSRELAFVTHYNEAVGDGQAFCMDVQLPELDEEGNGAVWCPVCGDASEGVEELTTRRPKWNPKHKSLTLDFNGRCTKASAKNFQLEVPGKPGKVKFLFGKVADHEFVLDYKRPLGPVQAFATALTTSHWK